jgi:hypothetical protein
VQSTLTSNVLKKKKQEQEQEQEEQEEKTFRTSINLEKQATSLNGDGFVKCKKNTRWGPC